VLARELYFAGNTVILDHGLGLYTFYAHLRQIATQEGTIAEKGQVIGEVGATGRVTGAHLHWAARLNSAKVDPLDLLRLPASEPSANFVPQENLHQADPTAPTRSINAVRLAAGSPLHQKLPNSEDAASELRGRMWHSAARPFGKSQKAVTEKPEQ
jgi:murein DD-endopeptidase MepM/ murein hydrolase activator NlpD